MKRLLLIATLVILPTQAMAESITLDQVIKESLQKNTSLFRVQREYEDKLANATETRLLDNPEMNIDATRASGENAPSHRVLVGRAEIGAAWSKKSNENREYLGLKLDDPSFNAPIYANLFKDEEGDTHSLIWSRPNNRRSD